MCSSDTVFAVFFCQCVALTPFSLFSLITMPISRARYERRLHWLCYAPKHAPSAWRGLPPRLPQCFLQKDVLSCVMPH
jgi:hypothetical protein